MYTARRESFADYALAQVGSGSVQGCMREVKDIEGMTFVVAGRYLVICCAHLCG